MDRSSAQIKLDRGYGKLAAKIGRVYGHYRAVTAHDPLAAANKLGELPCLFDQKGDFSVERVALHGRAMWFAAIDRTGVEVGDYLVGENGTYFIASMEDLKPTLAVKCNAVASIYRPGAARSSAYSRTGNTTAPMTLTDWPVSFLEGTKGERSTLNLPLDSRTPWFDCLIPVFSSSDVRPHDRLVLDNGSEWSISSPELTDLGWRITCGYASV